MKTLGLEDAAQLLMMSPKMLQLKACAGEIPAAKPGKRWVFIDLDLFDWLRTQYTINRQDVPKENVTCSLKEKISGITDLELRENQYIDLLAPVTKKKPGLLKYRLI
jgi:hypothetical protein